MKFFLDTEFIEGFKKPLFEKKRHFIDLISIGIVCEDGREYYAISNEFNPKDADEWVKSNVISKLEDKTVMRTGLITPTMRMSGYIWKTNEQIKRDLLTFFGCWGYHDFYRAPEGIEVYGYYADYDWVLFCSLFGRMIDLPKGFPMYCNDLKQMLDSKTDATGHFRYDNATMTLGALKDYDAYPKQIDEHNALSDAKWNYELYKFLQSL